MGAIQIRDGETIRFDANWNELGRVVDLSAITTVLDSDDGRAFELFGAAKYKVNSWSDGTGMSGSETTYYDASTGAKLVLVGRIRIAIRMSHLRTATTKMLTGIILEMNGQMVRAVFQTALLFSL